MGHTEMLLAVAGLEQNEVTERCRRLAEGDWSSFPPAEQAAFAFARRQAEAAWDIGDTDVAALIEAFGPERAIDVIWWTSRCHFMTRVADAFQLSLERENVFQPPSPARKADEGQAGEKAPD